MKLSGLESAESKIDNKKRLFLGHFITNDLLTGLLGLYLEIRSPTFFVRPELARAVRKSEGFVFLVRNG